MSDHSETEDARQCWDCGGTQFELLGSHNDIVAVCVECEAEFTPELLFIPEENDREDYEVA